MFVREDWTIFRNINTLTHKAGCRLKDLRSLVLKEVMDNALDASPGIKPKFGMNGSWYWIQDEGSGIPGTPEQIAHLFSIKRPLTSTKILRRPSRGALGNGIRVIVGSILASGGQLRVSTRGKLINLTLHDDGTTSVESVSPTDVKGTAIELVFGQSIPTKGKGDWALAELAANFHFAQIYQGQTSAFWYDSDTFYELMMAAGDTSVRKLIQQFDGFAENTKAGRLIEREVPETACNAIDREAADRIFGIMRQFSKPVSPRKIGRMIARSEDERTYAREFGELEVEPGRGKHSAEIPYVVEVLAMERGEDHKEDMLIAMVNGTPITGDMRIERRGKGEVAVFGCGIHHIIKRVSHRFFTAVINVTIPYMPITTDGKEPDFGRLLNQIGKCLGGATRKLRKEIAATISKQTDVIGDCLIDAIAKVSTQGKYRFSLRQLFYGVRPYVLQENPEGKGLEYNYFCRWISQYENENGEIPGMYRDPRGTLYHPHTGETISIGTVAVEEYKRPEWTFNKILYIEKEGLFEVLKQVQFPERFDCALLSSKGFASRAVRDLIDMLGDDWEEIHVFAIHDADGPGTCIYESLVEATVARPGRRVKVHNLGIEPWEGMKMGLQVETFEERKQRTMVADYIRDHTKDYKNRHDKRGYEWEEWFQTNRIELNAMTSEAFVEWIEAKFDDLEAKKVVPPSKVLEKALKSAAETKLRQQIAKKILAESGFEEKVERQMINVVGKMPDRQSLPGLVKEKLEHDKSQTWSNPIDQMAANLVSGE